jgi:Mn-dependent DtxR family transcriptional regulator
MSALTKHKTSSLNNANQNIVSNIPCVQIPVKCILDKNLNNNEKLFYADIYTTSKTMSAMSLSNKGYSEIYSVSPRTIAYWIKKLKDNNYINVQIHNNYYRALTTNPFADKPHYIKLPLSIRHSLDYTSTEKLLFAEIYTLTADDNNKFYVGNDYLATRYNVSTKCISVAINKLIKSDLIQASYRQYKEYKTKRILTIDENKLSKINKKFHNAMLAKAKKIEMKYDKKSLEKYNLISFYKDKDTNVINNTNDKDTNVVNNTNDKTDNIDNSTDKDAIFFYDKNRTYARRVKHNTYNINNINILLNYNKLLVAFFKKRKQGVFEIIKFEYKKNNYKKCVGFDSLPVTKQQGSLKKSKTIYNNNYKLFKNYKNNDKSSKSDIFIPYNNKKINPPNKEQSKLIHDTMVKLYNAIKLKNRITRKPNINKWSQSIWIMIQNMQYDENVICNIVKYYCEHIDDEYMPIVRSVTSFCEKMPYIAQQYHKERKKEFMIIYNSRGFFRRKLIDCDFFDVYVEKFKILGDDIEKYYNEQTQTVLPGADDYPSNEEYKKICKAKKLTYRECPDIYFTKEYKDFARNLNLNEYYQYIMN